MAANIREPSAFEIAILRENGMDPKDWGVMYSSADCIRLLNCATRDTITIFKGDRKW